MSWRVVAKKDFRDASRSKALWALTALFVLFMAGMAYVYTLLQESGGAAGTELESVGLLFFLLNPVTLLVPLTALVMAHKSVAGEVESGSAKFLLSLPHTRRDALAGKVAGRGAVLGAAVAVGLVVAAVVTVVMYDSFDAMAYLGFSALTLLLAVAYVAIAVGLSATTKDAGRATVLAAGFFVVFELAWAIVPIGIYYLLNNSFTPTGTPPEWYLLLNRIPPSSAFTNAVFGFLPGNAGTIAQYFPQNPPIYLSKWGALAILLAWAVAVPLVGYRVFDRADL
ncbi:ABC transporter permease [Halobacterium litoreum]|uniref:ABC transporter permease n=1 Tax=Halobacterium litoreum TaxID=2039234 RepID=A0ABD5NG24_9EURY|nr:ABC transporter permease [Halobacterium litoreum]UHH13270.1 ABC transporter permease [Halobacterium litoreum]